MAFHIYLSVLEYDSNGLPPQYDINNFFFMFE